MCNLYSLTSNQKAIIDLVRAMRDLTGNLPPMPGIFPDYSAPIVRNAPDGERELTLARWGMPSPVFALKGRNSDSGVTNVRNVASPRGVTQRHKAACLVRARRKPTARRYFRVPDDRAERRCRPDSPEGHAGHSDDDRGSGNVVEGARA
jgi:putative SOS response-associated peptidase YedK